MSLISEGLKKAHLEALRQDREQRRQYLGPGRIDVPSRSASPATVVGAAILGACVMVAASAVWIKRSPQSPPSVAARADPAPAAASVRSNPVAAAPVIPVTSAPSPVRSAPLPGPASRRVPVPPNPRIVPVESSPAGSDLLLADERVAAPAPRQRDHLKDGATYASPIQAPGGVEISLAGISSSQGESVAIMNGNVVRVGAAVGPFVVEAIERGRVQMRYIDVHIWVTY